MAQQVSLPSCIGEAGMELEQRVEDAKLNKEQKEEIIRDYAKFIRARASNTMNRIITEQDDEYSVALIAFNEALDTYDRTKGNFLAFAALVIRNRLLNYERTENRHKNSVPFSSLGSWDEEGNELEFDIEDTNTRTTDAALEIQSLAEELKEFQISFFELTKASPKSKKTKTACNAVVRYLLSSPVLICKLKEKKSIPSKLIKENVKVNDKLLERHRKYIITACIVLSGDYEILAEYFASVKEVIK